MNQLLYAVNFAVRQPYLHVEKFSCISAVSDLLALVWFIILKTFTHETCSYCKFRFDSHLIKFRSDIHGEFSFPYSLLHRQYPSIWTTSK